MFAVAKLVVQCGRRFKLDLRTGEEGFGRLSPVCGGCHFQIVKTLLTQRGNHLNFGASEQVVPHPTTMAIVLMF
jgi:hypothetical protein